MTLGLMVAACSGPEKIVVDKYFGALHQGDTQTITSFATVDFNKKVDDWKIVQTLSTAAQPAPLAELLKQAKEAEAAVTQNKRDYTSYNLEHTSEVDRVKELRKSNSKFPPQLQTVADTWEKFILKDKDLKKALAEAKSKVDKERATVAMSVGQVDSLESLAGTLTTMQIELLLTIDGSQTPYLMTLRQYKLQVPKGMRTMSRWVVYGLEPKK
jgi:hypothetical protein